MLLIMKGKVAQLSLTFNTRYRFAVVYNWLGACFQISFCSIRMGLIAIYNNITNQMTSSSGYKKRRIQFLKGGDLNGRFSFCRWTVRRFVGLLKRYILSYVKRAVSSYSWLCCTIQSTPQLSKRTVPLTTTLDRGGLLGAAVWEQRGGYSVWDLDNSWLLQFVGQFFDKTNANRWKSWFCKMRPFTSAKCCESSSF